MKLLTLPIVFLTLLSSSHVVASNIYDINEDGLIDGIDWLVVLKAALPLHEPIPGTDVNEDGTINLLDLVLIWEQFVNPLEEELKKVADEIGYLFKTGLLLGDFNEDGRVDLLDVVLVARDGGKKVPADDPKDKDGDGFITKKDIIAIFSGRLGRIYFLPDVIAPSAPRNRILPAKSHTTWGRMKHR